MCPHRARHPREHRQSFSSKVLHSRPLRARVVANLRHKLLTWPGRLARFVDEHLGYAHLMSKNAKNYTRDYTDPQLRERLKEEIKASNKGGQPGQWSARKSQLLAQEYEKRGGGYRYPEGLSTEQRGLQEWTEQRWQTASGSAQARHDGETERYLPAGAWEQLTPQQRRATQQTKRQVSRQGQQRSANPPATRSARRISELDTLTAKEAVKRARTLTAREAEYAMQHEREHQSRKTVLQQLESVARRK